MPTGRAKRIARRDDARPHCIAIFNRLFQADIVAVARAHIAHGGKACLQHRLRVADRSHAPETVGKFQPAIAANIGRAIEMDVHVDQAGQYGFARQVDMLDVAAPFYSARIGNAGDAAVFADKDCRKFDRLAGQTRRSFYLR